MMGKVLLPVRGEKYIEPVHIGLRWERGNFGAVVEITACMEHAVSTKLHNTRDDRERMNYVWHFTSMDTCRL
jgi:hypothetical protein